MELPEGITIKELVYPEALEIITGGSTTPLAVYEEEFAIGVVLEAAETAALGDYPVKLKFRYQACDDKSCFAPKNIRKEFTLSVVSPDSPVTTDSNTVFVSIAWDTGIEAALPLTSTEDTKADVPALPATVRIECAGLPG